MEKYEKKNFVDTPLIWSYDAYREKMHIDIGVKCCVEL